MTETEPMPLPDDAATCAVRGAALACVERGEGDPVVLVHGDVSDLRMWPPQLDAFAAAGYRVVAYSRRYAWPNPPLPPGHDDPLVGHVADLAALLGQRGLAPAHLVGNSFGGSICLTLAARRPELVRSLVVQEPPALELFVGAPPSPAALLALLVRRRRAAVALVRFGVGVMAPTARRLARGDVERALTGFSRAILGAERLRALPATRRQQMRDSAGSFGAHLTGALPPTAAGVRRIRAPALVLTGQAGHPTLKLLSGELDALLRASERVEIPGAAHFANEDAPDLFNRAVLGFVARAGGGAIPGRGGLPAADAGATMPA